ncbi:hypothetical protein MTBLM5_100072 [Magnetospirillum sp. LM-5]|nr:hypothetical protein MTBLM5_100072 [Magnetospirillum sp. LM-5]
MPGLPLGGSQGAPGGAWGFATADISERGTEVLPWDCSGFSQKYASSFNPSICPRIGYISPVRKANGALTSRQGGA